MPTKPLVYINFYYCSMLYVVYFSISNYFVSFFAILCKLNINMVNFEVLRRDRPANNLENTIPDKSSLMLP
jgi:hypothetical protein